MGTTYLPSLPAITNIRLSRKSHLQKSYDTSRGVSVSLRTLHAQRDVNVFPGNSINVLTAPPGTCTITRFAVPRKVAFEITESVSGAKLSARLQGLFLGFLNTLDWSLGSWNRFLELSYPQGFGGCFLDFLVLSIDCWKATRRRLQIAAEVSPFASRDVILYSMQTWNGAQHLSTRTFSCSSPKECHSVPNLNFACDEYCTGTTAN